MNKTNEIKEDHGKMSYEELAFEHREMKAKIERDNLIRHELLEVKNRLKWTTIRFQQIEKFSNEIFFAETLTSFSKLVVENFAKIFQQPCCFLYKYLPSRKAFRILEHIGANVLEPPALIEVGKAAIEIENKVSFLEENQVLFNALAPTIGAKGALFYPLYDTQEKLLGLIICGVKGAKKNKPIGRKDFLLFKMMAHKTALALESFKARQELAREIEERKVIEKELARSNEDLQQFAYIISHDLRAPLRNVKSFSQLLAKMYRNKLDGDGITFLDFIIGGVSKFDNLINDLLLYSRVSSWPITTDEVDLNDIVLETINDFYEPISQKEVVFKVAALPSIQAYALHMTQLFQNIIENAIKFRQPEKTSEILIRTEDKGKDVLFSISDNGIGIKKEYSERIFQLFQRLHTDNEYKGTGLGLSICKKIAERHNGKIWIESEGNNKGTTFFIQLPKKFEVAKA